MKVLKIPLSWQIVVSIIAALLIWYVFPMAAAYLGELTELYINGLTLLLVPYVFFTLMSVFSAESSNLFFGRIVLKNLFWFVTVETLAAVLSLLISNIFFMDSVIETANVENVHFELQRDFGDFVFSALPQNIFSAVMDHNLFSILLITCILGLLSTRCKDRTRTYFSSFFSSFSDLMEKCAVFASNLSPLGIFFFVCKLASDGNIFDNFEKIIPFLLAVTVSLLIHCMVVLPVIVKVFTKRSPFQVMKVFSSSLFITLSARSPILTLPFVAEKMKNEAGISSRVSFLSLPVAGVLSFNGTTVFLTVAAMYIAQAYGINLSVLEQLTLVFSVIFICVANFDFPLKMTVLLFPVLERIGIPIEGLGILVCCDLCFSMIASAADMWGNVCATLVIAKSEGDNIKFPFDEIKPPSE